MTFKVNKCLLYILYYLYFIFVTAPEKCSAPYVPRYATIQHLQLNYDYDDSITVTCDSSTAQFTLRCDTKGQWTGQVVSCPRPPQCKTFNFDLIAFTYPSPSEFDRFSH